MENTIIAARKNASGRPPCQRINTKNSATDTTSSAAVIKRPRAAHRVGSTAPIAQYESPITAPSTKITITQKRSIDTHPSNEKYHAKTR